MLFSTIFSLALLVFHHVDATSVHDMLRYSFAKVNRTAADQRAIRGSQIYPHYSNAKNQKWEWVNASSWVSGMFPGMLWYAYDYSLRHGLTHWADSLKLQAHNNLNQALHAESLNKQTHDAGFKIFLSFGLGYKYTKQQQYKQALVNAKNKKLTCYNQRFNAKVGAIKAWDYKAYQPYPVIVDTLMNLELLFYVSQQKLVCSSTAKVYRQIAVSHLQRTIKDMIRSDGCAWHRANYDEKTGKLLFLRGTPQGLDTSDSVWSRGQAWVVYGFTMAYRYTGQKQYLNIAKKAASCFQRQLDRLRINDYVPPFDFAAKGKDAAYKDTSATAILASALAELHQYSKGSVDFEKLALDMVTALYKDYRAPNNSSLGLLHGESHFQNGVHDRALIYGDFYYLEALLRLAHVSSSSKQL